MLGAGSLAAALLVQAEKARSLGQSAGIAKERMTYISASYQRSDPSPSLVRLLILVAALAIGCSCWGPTKSDFLPIVGRKNSMHGLQNSSRESSFFVNSSNPRGFQNLTVKTGFNSRDE